MIWFLLVLLIVTIFQVAKALDQHRRIQLLAQYLGKYRIEQLMQTLIEGYLRALGENEPERRQQIWRMLCSAELELSEQMQRLSQDFAQVWGEQALGSTLPVALPFAHKLLPQATFDMRQLLSIHAAGIADVVRNQAQRSQRDQAFMLCAEILLLQHSCHWFCRSQTVASARLLARHQTHYAQVIEAVSPTTRGAYLQAVKAARTPVTPGF